MSRPAVTAIALYDLDRTITIAPTFTRFLAYMARRSSAWRSFVLPLWIMAMVAYKLGLCRREALKSFGLRLLVGPVVRNARLQPFIDQFVARQVAGNIRPAALRQIEQDRADGRLLVMVTAAPEIYAEALATKLGFAACLATRHVRTAEGDLLCTIDGGNNYAAEKVRRVEEWMQAAGLDRQNCRITAYTDHASDAPILDFADRSFLVKPISGKAPWQQLDWG